MLLVCTRCQGPAAYVEFTVPLGSSVSFVKVTCAPCVERIFAERANDVFERDVNPTPLPARMPPESHRSPTANDSPVPSVYGQQVAESRGRGSYDAGTCFLCGKPAIVRYVPRPGGEGTHKCFVCWKAGK